MREVGVIGLRPGLRAEPKPATGVGYEPANLPVNGESLKPSQRGGGQWLPLPTGWMKAEKEINRIFLKLHVVVTLIAYVIFVVWLIKGAAIIGFAFLEIWWLAVAFGVLMNY